MTTNMKYLSSSLDFQAARITTFVSKYRLLGQPPSTWLRSHFQQPYLKKAFLNGYDGVGLLSLSFFLDIIGYL